MTDWYRRTTWSERDRADFFERLKRARGSSSKAQYLRIQASHLQEVGEPSCVRAALELLELMVADYPEAIQLAQAHKQRAECLIDLGDRNAALVAYRDALDAERKLPNVRTDAHIGFGELVLDLEREDLYPEALSVLDEFGTDEPFPIQRYRLFAVRALVCERLGQLPEARQCAEHALDAAAATESPFRYRRRLGLVADQDSDTHGRLLALVGRAH
jgi:tetratricopeptide (TPR) repeat protein